MWSQKEVQSLTNQITAIERYKTIKLNTSTLDEIVNERYHHNGFAWIWRHTNDFVDISAMCGKTFIEMPFQKSCLIKHNDDWNCLYSNLGQKVYISCI